MDKKYKKRIERYWDKMQENANEVFSSIDPDDWFDYWHTHPDCDGKGNSKPENRIRANELTYALLQNAEKITEHRKNTIQCWAIITEDSMNNSVYIHTKNPNGTEFPFTYKDVKWNINNQEIEQIIDSSNHQIGLYVGEHENTYYIRKKA